jgi:sulfoxide reductase heme-binding subunit YedZ
LAVFVYSFLHLLAYLLLLLGLEFNELGADIQKRPYKLFGFAAFVLLAPLAVTSTNNWQRRLMSNWKRLHKLVFIVIILVLMHLWWQVRADFGLAFFGTHIAAIIIAIKIKPSLLARLKTSSTL